MVLDPPMPKELMHMNGGTPMIAHWLLVFLTLVIAIFTYLAWKVYEKIAWLTGAIESHSDLMLRIEALRGIHGKATELVWWDPDN
jgi:hypothetical protein